MQVSLNWLRDYIDIDCSAEELAEKLTMAGIPVENLIREDAGLEKVVTGRIEKLERHPDSDHMWICQMNVGKFSGRYRPSCDGWRGSSMWQKNFEGKIARRCIEWNALFAG